MAFAIFVTAVVATIVWSIADRKRPNYGTLQDWFRVLLRLWVAESMASYGAAKLFPVQYSRPLLGQFLTRYGDSSPMGLLWTFMDSSRPYAMFTGAAEMLGALLLIVPRVATLGALVTVAAMANVFALNLSYDVPVKIRSSHILLGALVLAAPDARRLVQFFATRKPVALREDSPLAGARTARLLTVAQVVFGAIMIATLTNTARKNAAEYTATREWPLAGYWRVDSYVVDGAELPPLVTDAVRWQRLMFDTRQTGSLQMMDGEIIACRIRFDEAHKTFNITATNGPRFSISPPQWTAHVTYTQPDGDTLIAETTRAGKRIALRLRREPKTFPLETRGFHLINEFPFNQ
jgi:uncharacterized membrane protein YphA (DoxX/SURF4 family)